MPEYKIESEDSCPIYITAIGFDKDSGTIRLNFNPFLIRKPHEGMQDAIDRVFSDRENPFKTPAPVYATTQDTPRDGHQDHHLIQSIAEGITGYKYAVCEDKGVRLSFVYDHDQAEDALPRLLYKLCHSYMIDEETAEKACNKLLSNQGQSTNHWTRFIKERGDRAVGE